MARPSLSQLLTRSGGLMAARVAGGAIALLTNILIARYYGAEALGIFALVMAAVSLVAIVLPLGFQAVSILFVSRYLEQGRRDLVAGFADRGYRNIARLTGVAALGVVVGAIAAPAGGWHEQVICAGFVAAMAPAVALINLNCNILNGHRRQFAGLLPDLLIKPALMTAAVGLTIVLFDGASIPLMLGAICLALWAAALCHVPAMRPVLAGVRKAPAPEAKRWREAAWPWMAISALSDYFIELHLLLAGMLAAPAQIAVLHVCFRLRMLAAFGLRALYALILPDIFASYERKDKAEFRSNIARANALALVYAVTVCLAIVPLGNWVLSLFGEAFENGRAILLIVCSAMISRAVFGPAPAIMAMKGQHGSVIWILSLGTAISLALGLALFPALGVEAIAIAYTVSYSLIAVAQWWWVKRKTGIDCSIFAGLGRGEEVRPVQAG